MKTLRNWIARFNLGSTIALAMLVGIWSIPTVGLLITSFRLRSEAEISPWWDAIIDPFGTVWSLEAYQNSLDS